MNTTNRKRNRTTGAPSARRFILRFLSRAVIVYLAVGFCIFVSMGVFSNAPIPAIVRAATAWPVPVGYFLATIAGMGAAKVVASMSSII